MDWLGEEVRIAPYNPLNEICIKMRYILVLYSFVPWEIVQSIKTIKG